MKTPPKKLPKEIIVYQCDEMDGETIWAVASSPDNISEDYDGELIGFYKLDATAKFVIERKIIAEENHKPIKGKGE